MPIQTSEAKRKAPQPAGVKFKRLDDILTAIRKANLIEIEAQWPYIRGQAGHLIMAYALTEYVSASRHSSIGGATHLTPELYMNSPIY
jgi:hypothetical protein